MSDATAGDGVEQGPSTLLVSACLLGVACNHRASASPRPAVLALAHRFALVPVCPEVAGGLAVPRDPAELVAGGHVVTVAGEDVTSAYRRGAEVAVDLARRHRVHGAVLKARSPSCGCRQVYDGTFTRTLVDGEGVCAAALRAAGVDVVSDEDVAAGHLPGTRAGIVSAPREPPSDDR